ncbi:hypothetical protein ASG87_16165 [Frateuria sp. Soil773]|uniref:helix-turn-helix domain-containing protein n=1 Tax=Frateuria sp. Soil773 TaxID=1736407 RepID=UPI0007022E3A|nr:AraC family transcriptional regulator [Frateuria sp. Soil773]KRE96528.1 hypothetical protein ASG87_16165 [Frateuria sp. Soil773]
MSILQVVLRSSSFTVVDQVCRHPRVNCGGPSGDEPARFIFTRRGSFAVHAGRRTCFAQPGKAVLVRRNVEYRIAHPDAGGCDCCTDVWIDDAVLDMLGMGGAAEPPCREFPHDLEFQRTHLEMFHGFRHDGDAAREADEVLLDVLGCLLRPDGAGRARPRSAVAARQVARVEEAIVGHAGDNLGIDALARLAGCSPFHLCRIFRESTGHSLRQFRLRLRLGDALGRLGEGEEDLAALACDVGFSSHSHMTEAFRRALGASPRVLREELRHSDLRRLKGRLRAMPSMGRHAPARG